MRSTNVTEGAQTPSEQPITPDLIEAHVVFWTLKRVDPATIRLMVRELRAGTLPPSVIAHPWRKRSPSRDPR